MSSSILNISSRLPNKHITLNMSKPEPLIWLDKQDFPTVFPSSKMATLSFQSPWPKTKEWSLSPQFLLQNISRIWPLSCYHSALNHHNILPGLLQCLFLSTRQCFICARNRTVSSLMRTQITRHYYPLLMMVNYCHLLRKQSFKI